MVGRTQMHPEALLDHAIADSPEWRKMRFRVLACVDGSDSSYDGLRFAAQIGKADECDIVLLNVRPVDQGLRTGGMQVRLARENLLNWGLELPGVEQLKRAFDLLLEYGHSVHEWDRQHAHSEKWGDPVGDSKIEYRSDNNKRIVLKLKVAPDVAAGILDQYELGPYNLVIMGEPSRWQGELRSLLHASITQKVAVLSFCSTLITRRYEPGHGFLICTDGSSQSRLAAKRASVLAHICGESITLLSVTTSSGGVEKAERLVERTKLIVEGHGIPIVRTLVRVGDPTETIIEEGKDYSLTVVSDSGK
ncbi:MAG: universal stress protein, partial [Gammaproteobacteria bacterium]|nr:universal stress protein [Gammaproteobacteria bacterium]